MVRLVKGAYWDTEVKRAQERGLADYPVFTRKAMTDLCYLPARASCWPRGARLYPQFATHNALTVASVIEDAGGVEGYEFQRLHGMGEVLYETLLAELPQAAVPGLRAGRRPSRPARLSGAAAAGERRQLLVRLGRGRSVGADRDDAQAAAELDRRRAARPPPENPAAARPLWAGAAQFRRRRVRRPREPRRRLLAEIRAPMRLGEGRAADRRRRARRHRARARISPIDGASIGRVREGDDAIARAAMAAAAGGLRRIGRRRRSRSAPRRSNAPAICWRRGAAG